MTKSMWQSEREDTLSDGADDHVKGRCTDLRKQELAKAI